MRDEDITSSNKGFALVVSRLLDLPVLSRVGLAGCLLAAGGVVALGDLRTEAGSMLALAALWSTCAVLAGLTLRDREQLPAAVLLGGVLLRLIVLASPATLSDDLFRYLWEGRVQLAGMNPFLYAPDSGALEGLRDATWEAVNHKEVSTIYPPGALLLFRGAAAVHEAPITWKLMSGAADVGLMLLLARGCRERGVNAWAPALYALLPLPVLESAGSGHLESIALLCLLAGLVVKPRGWAAFLVGLGGLVKLLPLLAWWPQLRRDRRALAGILGTLVLGAALTWPLLDAGPTLLRGFTTYADTWAFNASFFHLLQWCFEEDARLVGVGIGAVWAGLSAWRRRDPALFVLDVAAALLLLSPVVHPWYVLWALVPALLTGRWAWVTLGVTTMAAYAVLVGYDPAVPGSWSEPEWVVWIEIPPLLAALGVAAWRRRSKGSLPS